MLLYRQAVPELTLKAPLDSQKKQTLLKAFKEVSRRYGALEAALAVSWALVESIELPMARKYHPLRDLKYGPLLWRWCIMVLHWAYKHSEVEAHSRQLSDIFWTGLLQLVWDSTLFQI